MTTAPKVTYEEFLARTDEDTAAEWVDGEIVRMAPESGTHQDKGFFLLTLIGTYVQERGLGVVRYERFQMKVSSDGPGREPDLLFVANENLSRLHETYLEGPADLVVEIISPESIARDRGEKFAEYEAGDVPEFWLLDPLRQESSFYQRGEDSLYRLVPPDADGIYHSRVLPGLWLRVSWLWQTPSPRLLDILRERGLL